MCIVATDAAVTTWVSSSRFLHRHVISYFDREIVFTLRIPGKFSGVMESGNFCLPLANPIFFGLQFTTVFQ